MAPNEIDKKLKTPLSKSAVEGIVMRDAVERVLLNYCDGTFNGLQDAHFIEYSYDGKTPQDCLDEIMIALNA